MKLAIGFHQLLADRRVVESCQPPRSNRIEELLVKQLFTNRPQVGRAAIDESAQCRFSGAQFGSGIERHSFNRIQRAPIAENYAKVAHLVANNNALRILQALRERVPRTW